MSCRCRCHVYGAGTGVSCDVGPEQPGGSQSCTVTHEVIPLDKACVMPHPENRKRFSGLLCGRHYHWLNNTLDEMTELYALIPEVIMPSMGAAEVKVRGGGDNGSPAPGRIDIMALTELRDDLRTPRDPGDELWYELPDMPRIIPALETWGRMVAEERDMDTAPLDSTFTSAVRFLRGQRVWIAAQLWVDDYANELTSLHRALARAIGDTMWPKPIGKCPNCQTPMFNTIGIDEVTCRKCRTTWAGVALARLRLIHEQERARANDRSSAAASERRAAGDASGGSPVVASAS